MRMTTILISVLVTVSGVSASEITIVLERTGSWDIPDLGSFCDYWDVSGIPSGSAVTHIDYEFLVEDQGDPLNFWCMDYEIYLSNAPLGGDCLWDRWGGHTDGGADDDAEDDTDIDLDRSTYAFSGADPGQRWYVRIYDTVSLHLSGLCLGCPGLGCLKHDKLVIHYNVPVPDVSSLTRATAHSHIVDGDLAVGTESYQCSNTVPADSVISQSPSAGTMVYAGCPVNLVISSSPCGGQVTVPNVMGMTESQAASAITSAGLTVGTKWYGESDTVPAGYVMGQDPAAGTPIAPGSELDFCHF
jgi:hypothetical protein